MTNKKKYGKSVKCPHCEKDIDRNIESFSEHSKRYYHQECYDIKFTDMMDRERLHQYICALHGMEFVNIHIRKQIKEYQEPPFNFTLKGILTTLRYAHGIERVPIKKDVGIGIIEFYYKKAIEYYTNIIRIRDIAEEIDSYEEDVIYIKPPQERKKKMIDIGGL